MKKELFLCMIAGVFILSGCLEFKKVDLQDYSVNLDLRSDMEISSDGMQVQQYLKKITLNDLDLNVAGDSVKLMPNEKNRVEIDLTYLPISKRQRSFEAIAKALKQTAKHRN